jgi:SAM-dependent methyltransferase
MKINLGAYVLDSGCGYSWTTEWLMKMGVHAIGLELVRRYVDTGRVRMGANQPDIVIADAENLPFKPTFFDAVLAFDAFHHIPNRNVAMREFSRVLKPGGNVVLVEPGGEVSPAAMQIMETLGTLEVGMELSDVREYVAGNGFDEPKETFLIPFSTADQRQVVPAEELRNRNFIGWCLYTVSKRAGEGHGGGLK